jgi:polysaccharide export outer membrane protein
MSRVIPRPPYHLEPLDELHLQVPPQDLLPGEPINGVYTVDAQGRIDLAYSYGKVDVAGLTLDEATEAIRATLSRLLKPPRLVVTLGRTRTFEPIQGLHLVRMDGTVSLGSYGDVYVAGRSLSEARQIIEAHLSRTLLRPEVTVDVAGYNSKVYYIIYDTSRQTQEVVRLPIVGGETVLDALSHVTGLLPAGKRIWIARPAPDHVGFRQILPVDWEAITQGGATHTNYQLLPGDRLFVQAKPCGLWQSCKLQLSSTFERLSGKERK